MRIRRATSADLATVADFYASAFLEEPLTAWLYPGRKEFYEEYRRAWLGEVKGYFYAAGMICWVVEVEEEAVDVKLEGEREGGGKKKDKGEDKGKVVGFAVWERHFGEAEDDEKEVRRKWMGDSVARKIHRVINQLNTSTSSSNPAASPAHHSIFAAAPDAFHTIPSRWHLVALATSPAFQRRGVARHLTTWGLGVAAAEGVPVTLDSTVMAEALYRGLGFRAYSCNVLAPGVEGLAMIWEPMGVEERGMVGGGEGGDREGGGSRQVEGGGSGQAEGGGGEGQE